MTTRPDVRKRHAEQREQTRRRILDVARGLLEDRPWSEVSIDEVTKGADLTRTAFYRHFPDQRALLMALVEDVGLQLDVIADPWVLTDGDPAEQVHAALADLAAVYQQHGRLLRAIADAATQDREVAQMYTALGARLSKAAADRIRHEVEHGRSKVADPDEVAAALVWMNERYLLDRFGRAPIASDPDRAALALTEVWVRTVYG
ncbi:MAG TPA: TetR/AcrR family transcriptional regulator [Solirubrobacteraceae bacterium]|nr:TetR/AcrR family transcriptional regulator [Solirubrobacteraceae bacterium]